MTDVAFAIVAAVVVAVAVFDLYRITKRKEHE